jgi:hypothetical protein
MTEHPVEQEILWAQIDTIEHQETRWVLHHGGVTRIGACTKSGMCADIPYIRIWKGDICVAEYCQHNIVGIGFREPDSTIDPL